METCGDCPYYYPVKPTDDFFFVSYLKEYVSQNSPKAM